VVDPTNAAQVAEAALMASRLQQQETGESSADDTNQSTSQTNGKFTVHFLSCQRNW